MTDERSKQLLDLASHGDKVKLEGRITDADMTVLHLDDSRILEVDHATKKPEKPE